MTAPQTKKTEQGGRNRRAQEELDLDDVEIRRKLAPEKLGELRLLLEAVFKDGSAARHWLNSSVPALNGRTPISVLKSGSIEPLLDTLATFESGAFR